MGLSKDWLVVQINDELVNAMLHVTTEPPVWLDGEMMIGAQKKYSYHLENGTHIACSNTKKEAADTLLAVAKDQTWRVFQPLN
jgi:hypothetical protein